MKRNNITASGAIKPRYSNKTVTDANGNVTETAWYESIDWGGGLNSITNLFSSIWGKSDKYTAQLYQSMYKEQQRTTTILWFVIAIIVVLGVVLVVRKKK